MTYTDKYLIHTITNKQFKRKYGAKSYTRAKVVNETWMQRILRKNPWLKAKELTSAERYRQYVLCDPIDSLQPADQAHLDSIRNELWK